MSKQKFYRVHSMNPQVIIRKNILDFWCARARMEMVINTKII